MLVGGLKTREEPPAAGSWQGQPRSHRRTARGGAGEGVRAPETGRSGLACDGPAITCGGPGPPWETGSAGATRELSSFPGDVGAPVPE
jgi:hypothetical protein